MPRSALTPATDTDWLTANIDAMHRAATDGSGMDVVIVSTGSPLQEAYWQTRLEATRGQVAGRDSLVLAVCEDWPGGAGNGLGTLYALQQAAAKARALTGTDLLARLRDGASVALYHTAGKGTRMAPLPGCEANNKPGVKLPGTVVIDGAATPITILEAVIRQTALYAASRRGRVSVFWGDQIFIPTIDPRYTPRHHADILCRLDAMPDAAAWQTRGMSKYGLIAVDDRGDARQVEKIEHAVVADLVRRGRLAVNGGIGVSLGSFSLSAPLLEALLAEFAEPLASRSGKLDTDPHFWMPLTLDAETYQGIMATKGTDPAFAAAHHARMQAFGAKLLATSDDGLKLFGAVDVGAGAAWWDYGVLSHYHANNLRLVGDDAEAAAMRRFFGIGDRRAGSTLGAGLDVDAESIVLDCTISRGTIRRSVLIGVDATSVDCEDTLLLAVAAPTISAHGAVLYNVADSQPLCLTAGQVRADAHLSLNEHVIMTSDLERHGGDDWHSTLPGNPCSYEALHRRNHAVDPAAAEGHATARRQDAMPRSAAP